MASKKKGSIILKILGLLFIVYIALFIANLSGYYENKIRNDVTITEEAIKEFEAKVKDGEEITLSSYLESNAEDYGNFASNLGERVTENLEVVLTKGFNTFKNIFKTLF